MTDVVAALIWNESRFLACQRPAHKARGLLWEFVGGKVESGETPQQALIRECREELAVTVVPNEVFMEVIHEYPDLTVRLILFNAVITDGMPQRLEHNDIRWITTAEIDNYSFCPADKDILAVLKGIDGELQAVLHANRDAGYHAFHTRLLPGIDPATVMGVRMPVLRKLHKRFPMPGILPHRFYEENILHALYINDLKDAKHAISALDSFLPFVNNWAVCDALSPKCFQSRPEALLTAVDRWLKSDHPYTIRFGIEVLMKYYLDNGFRPEFLRRVAGIRNDHYYVNMMIAWYFATALAKQYDATIPILQHRLLGDWTHNKTIQKACESCHITPEQKAYLRTMKTERSTTK